MKTRWKVGVLGGCAFGTAVASGGIWTAVRPPRNEELIYQVAARHDALQDVGAGHHDRGEFVDPAGFWDFVLNSDGIAGVGNQSVSIIGNLFHHHTHHENFQGGLFVMRWAFTTSSVTQDNNTYVTYVVPAQLSPTNWVWHDQAAGHYDLLTHADLRVTVLQNNSGYKSIWRMDVNVEAFHVVPTPGSAALLSLGTLGMLRRRRGVAD